MRWQMWTQRVMTTLYRLFQGRYRVDQLSILLLAVALLCSFIAQLFRLPWLMLLYYAGMIYAFWRMFSRNYAARSRENQKLLSFAYKVRARFRILRRRIRDRKMYRYLKCPSCGQYLRVPKGKGNIEITCSTCRTSFIRKV